ncbi:hypothetical protein K2173_001643 [Erythroxylum novogranatense]|uniref:Uncharacterized protein n=1 Tax=Erythroxylum novogranatense TaxID=1862640 RepID=A0AAV8T572_9ROSI|nr:hypothetical protein K2173_001643 [Erythroxylum novogranatense]
MANSLRENKPFRLVVLAMATWASMVCLHALNDVNDTTMVTMHETWMSQYNRVYNDKVEKEQRYNNFKENVKFIESFNKDSNRTYELGINRFADMTREEFSAIYNQYKVTHYPSRSPTTPFSHGKVNSVPRRVDWRKRGAVTPAKSQGKCGITKISTGKLTRVSVQEIIDCDKYGQGCNGGFLDEAFQFIIQNKGLTSAAEYPYEDKEGTCKRKKAEHSVARIRGYEYVPANNERALLNAVSLQPVSAVIDAGSSAIQFYKSGVFTGYCGTEMNHAVAIVGYGSTPAKKYWIVKNSWGSDWGENGYIRLLRNFKSKEGLCGIAKQGIYPTM